ncbi:MAG TPA: chemotaxis response regulator protein-glutamate methylesterase [Burkholderiales bacterium]|nr:chemotaxis response regulator protein-glutamate methylesterase [Burkholderiales bacterium]
MTLAQAERGRKISVLVIDDSAMIRKLLTEIINAQPDMVCVGAAPDPLVAREMIRNLNPDVLTLDVEMPRMDGLSFLEKLMRLRPTPVIMVSTLTQQGSEMTLGALELGAVDFIAKPKLDIARGLTSYAQEIADKIRMAASSRPRKSVPPSVAPNLNADVILPQAPNRAISTEKLIAIGASTGGTEALKHVLTVLPPDSPGILVAQHMPERFTRSFAQRLDGLSRIRVKEAEDGERVLPGHAYIAPGHSHLMLKRSGANYVVELSQGPPVNRHRPSVDVLFRSVANGAGRNAIGVILTGMGKDGAAGLLEMKNAGAHTVAQDEATCVVFGMPREAIALGAADLVLPLGQIVLHVIAAIGSHRAIRV